MNSICSEDDNSFSSIICDVVDTCIGGILNPDRRQSLTQLLTRLQDFRKYYGYNDPSITGILDEIGTCLQGSRLSLLSLHFYQEKLRIEKFYLGPHHPDLASTLYDIGQVYVENGQISEATECYIKAFFLLKKSNTDRKLISLILFNLGLIKYESSPVDAMKIFNRSIIAQQDSVGEFHPDVAEMYLSIGRLQLQSKMRDKAMESFLKALIISRIVYGNNSNRVGEILYQIGLCHKEKSEYILALNSFHQSMEIAKRFEEIECMIVILHKISLVHRSIGDFNKTITTLQEIIHIIKRKVGEKHVCVAIVLGQLCTLYADKGMIEKSKKAAKKISFICNMSEYANYDSTYKFINFINKLFGYVLEENSTSIVAAAAA